MIAHNLCFSTLVGVVPRNKEIETQDGHLIVTVSETEKAIFRQTGDRGIIPSILRVFLDRRKNVRAAMKTMTDESEKSRANAKQKALKVACNSFYGAMGASTFPIQCMSVAAAVTQIGRSSLEKVCSIIPTMEDQLPCKARIIYGDSVTGDTILMLRRENQAFTCRIDEVTQEWVGSLTGKNLFYTSDLEIWTDKGFVPIYKIIRHRCDKRLFRIVTSMGSVVVTEDHSLLREDATCVRPAEVFVGQRLLMAARFDLQLTAYVSDAYLFGVFLFVGGLDPIWNLEIHDERIRAKVLKCISFPVREVGVFILCDDEQIRQHYHTLFFNKSKEMHVPTTVLNARHSQLVEFWNGVRDVKPDEWMVLHGAQLFSDMFFILQRLGQRSLRLRDVVDGKAYVVDFLKPMSATILSITPLAPSKEWVFDVQTDNGHFGVCGGLVVHNTDSVMVEFETTVDVATCEKIAAHVTSHFPPPMRLCFENMFQSYLLDKKKRYAGMLAGSDKVVVKGLGTQRRDIPLIVQEMLKAILDDLLHGREDAFVLSHLRSILSSMPERAMTDFVITKELSRGFTSNKDVVTAMKWNVMGGHHVFHGIDVSNDLSSRFKDEEDGNVVVGEVEKLLWGGKIKSLLNHNSYKSFMLPQTVIAQKRVKRGEQTRIGDRIDYVVIPGRGKVSERVEEPCRADVVDLCYYVSLIETQCGPMMELAGMGQAFRRLLREFQDNFRMGVSQKRITDFFK